MVLNEFGFAIKVDADLSYFYMKESTLIAQLHNLIEIDRQPFTYSALEATHDELLERIIQEIIPNQNIEEIKSELEFVEKY